MLEKLKILQHIVDSGFVVAIRTDSMDQAIEVAQACRQAGVGAMEITFTIPDADRAIHELAHRFPNQEFVLGAGTVLDPETARIAILAGAQYIVTPSLNEATVRLCNRYQVPCIPGAMTVQEVCRAMECGSDIIKLFPGELFGPSAIRAIHGPLPQANLLPTGGVSLENVSDWIAAGAVAVAVGGALTRALISGGPAAVTQTARQFLERIRIARQSRSSKAV